MALFLPYVAVCHGILPTRKEFRPENRVLFSNKLGPQVFFKADSSIFISFFQSWHSGINWFNRKHNLKDCGLLP